MKSLAVYNSPLDEYTLCLLTGIKLDNLREVLRILLKYLILEKNNDSYLINEFANKYILQRFIPNSVERNDLYLQVTSNVRSIKRELDELDRKAQQNSELKKILNDWMADSYGDKIAISKAYSLYNNLIHSLKLEGGSIREQSIEQYIREFESISRVTIHPYIDFQKAVSLSTIDNEFRTNKHQRQIKKAYEQCIATTRFNYQHIKTTYSFAIVLWRYGQYLARNVHDNATAAKYLEDAVDVFKLNDTSSPSFYKCLSLLGNTYYSLYGETQNLNYKKSAQNIYDELNRNRRKVEKRFIKFIDQLGELLNT